MLQQIVLYIIIGPQHMHVGISRISHKALADITLHILQWALSLIELHGEYKIYECS